MLPTLPIVADEFDEQLKKLIDKAIASNKWVEDEFYLAEFLEIVRDRVYEARAVLDGQALLVLIQEVDSE